MITWTWTKQNVSPEIILDAVRNIPVTDQRCETDFAGRWIRSDRYFAWARDALHRGGDDGWDAAAGWAKRAVCRRMDGILANNHLGHFLGRNYKDKAEYLKHLKVPGLTALRDLVIDPRNDIEHAYEPATEEHARRACDVAELFLGATEAESPAVISLGWKMDYSEFIGGDCPGSA